MARVYTVINKEKEGSFVLLYHYVICWFFSFICVICMYLMKEIIYLVLSESLVFS